MTQKRNRSSTQSTKSNGSVTTAEKKVVSKKRMREEDSEDGTEKTETEVQHIKKIKQMLADEGGSSDDASVEVDVSDDDEDDVSDDDEDSDDDEEDSEHDGDTEDEFPEKVVLPKEPKTNKKEKQQPPTKTVAAEKPVEEKNQVVSRVVEPFKPSPSNIMLFNIPRINEVELRGFLSKRNVNPESISCINGPVALLGFSSESAAKKALSTCSGVTYNQGILAAVPASGEDLALIKSNKNPHPSRGDAPLTCLFITDLPKAISERDLIETIRIEPKHIRLITSGPRNRLTNACYIDCKSEADAQKAFQALSVQQFGGKAVKVFLKPQFNFNPVTENSVIVTNVPFSADVETIKKEFPDAKKVEVTRRGCFMLYFENSDVRDKVVKESQGKILEGRELRFITTDKVHTDVAVFVSNVSFTATVDDLKAAFPGCKNVFMKKNNGKFSGNAIVYFKTKEDAESAVKSAAKKEIDGRPLKVKMSHMEQNAASETHKKEAKDVAPKATESKKTKGVEIPVQVGSDSEDDDNADDSEDDAEAAEDSSDDDGDDEYDDGQANADDAESEEDQPPEKKRTKLDEGKASNAKPPFKQRGGNRGGGFRGGNRGGGNRGVGGGFRGGNRGRGHGFRGGRGRGVFRN